MRMITIGQKTKLRMMLFCIAIVIVLAGLGIGFITGSQLLIHAIKSGSGSYMLFQPTHEFYTVHAMINGNDELRRLSGYYSLLNNDYVDEDFLIHRYSLENSPVIKRTIIWVLGFSKNNSTTTNFFSRIYKKSDSEIQQQILDSLKKSNEAAYNTFIDKNKIKKAIVPYYHD